MTRGLILFIILVYIVTFPLDSASAKRLHLKSGLTLKGEILEESAERIVFKTTEGAMTWHKSEIDKIDDDFIRKEETQKTQKTQETSAYTERLVRVGAKHFNNKDFDKAIDIYKMALLKANNKKVKATILFNLSSAYLEKGILPYAQNSDDTYYRKSVEYAQMCLDVIPYYWQAIANVGVVHMNMKNLDKADYYFTEAQKRAVPNSPNYRQLLMMHGMVKGAIQMRDRGQTKSWN